MLDIKFIRENKELIKDAARKKHINFDVDKLIDLDEKRREVLAEVEKLRSEQNQMSEKISKTDPEVREQLIEKMKTFKDDLKEKEEKLKEVMRDWQLQMLAVPNIPDITVPEGLNEEENVEIRQSGEKPKFDFEPKNHVDLMTDLDLLDLERGAKVSGFRGYFLKGQAANLSFALWNFFWQEFLQKGFQPMISPSLVRKEALMGTGYLPGGEDDLYKTQDDTYLAGTAEVSTMAYHMNENISINDLPKKIIAFSPCFRREAGAHGKDTKGLVRVHEFFKLEQLIFCEASHQQSVQLHEEMTANVESILEKLGLHFRVVVNCGGDLGQGQVKKYDIEVWSPSEGKYRETHSASYFHDFQSRRLNIKYKDRDGKSRFVHSLNNTVVATPRFLSLVLENNQQADGSIEIPEALRSYVGTDLISKG